MRGLWSGTPGGARGEWGEEDFRGEMVGLWRSRPRQNGDE